MWKDQRPQNVENRFCGGENSYKQFDSIPCESERSGFICQYNCSAFGCHRTECTFHLESHYTCDCEDGYNTTHCDFEINECETNPCLHHANCTDSLNSYTCTCAPGFTGTNCETNIDECSSFPCSNNGSCKDSIDSYVCTCLSGFTGVVCETEANECESNPCAPGEMCVDLVGMYNCSCDENNGTSCEEGSNEHVCTGADCYVGMLRILQGVFATTVVASWTGFGIMVQRYYRKRKTEDEPVINVAEDMAVEETKQP